MKLIYAIPILAVIILICTAGCVTVQPDPDNPTAPQPTVTTPTVSPATPAATDKLIGTWKLTDSKAHGDKASISCYTITFNEDGTCTETDYWTDGDASHWIGNWKKTGDNTYVYDTYPLFTLKDGVLHAWYDSIPMYGSTTFVGKWVQKDEDKSIIYFEYTFNSNGTGTQTRKSDMNDQTQVMNFPLTWKDFGNGNYQVFLDDQRVTYDVTMLDDNTIFEPGLNDKLVRI